nr:hypothetical protein Iba_chr12aCG13780 [Ipomoea batatas]
MIAAMGSYIEHGSINSELDTISRHVIEIVHSSFQTLRVRKQFSMRPIQDLFEGKHLVGHHAPQKCCCLSAEAVLFLHLFFSVRADYNHSFRLDWLHSSSLLRRRLSRHLHLQQQQLHPHSQHQNISAANQEIKAGDKFFRTSDLKQQSMMMGCGGMAYRN